MQRLTLALLLVALSSLSPTVSAQPAHLADNPPGGVYLDCFLLASGGADHSADPDPASYDLHGYVQWQDGTGQVIECRSADPHSLTGRGAS